ncbi:DUF6198 family protein [Atopobiaceae bacterium 24-176]
MGDAGTDARGPGRGVLARVTLMAVGVLLVGMSVALSKHSLTGTTPISVVPAVFYDLFQDNGITAVSLGMCSFAMNALCLVAELVLLRRRFPVAQLLQVPVVLAMSASVDMWMLLFDPIPNDVYPVQLLCTVVSVAVLALGVYLQTTADLLMTPGDALASVISRLSGHTYHRVKVAFDVVLVAAGAAFSLLFFSELRNVREGTVLAAVGTGFVIALWAKALGPAMGRIPKTRLSWIPPVVPADLDKSLDENGDRSV